MMKRVSSFLVAFLFATTSGAQFVPGQVLGAAALNAALASPTITAGSINGSPIGQTDPRAVNATSVGVVGATSGTVSILPQSAAGTYNFNLPTTAGAAGSVLTSSAGGSTPMTWTPQSSLVAGVASAAATVSTATTGAFYPLIVASAANSNQTFNLSGNYSYNPGTSVLAVPTAAVSTVNLGSGSDTYLTRSAAKQVLISGDGVGSGVNAGWKLGYLGTSGYSGLWSSDLTPSTTNYILKGHASAGTWLSAFGGDVSIEAPNGTTKALVSSTAGKGLYVTAGTASTNVAGIYVSQVWSNAGTSFTQILGQVTDGASAATSVLMDLRVGAYSMFNIHKSGRIGQDQTITASTTTGNQTINKPMGTVNFAPTATSITVTNSLVSTASTVFCSVRVADATAYIKNCVPAAGSFQITLGAAATATASVGFMVVN